MSKIRVLVLIPSYFDLITAESLIREIKELQSMRIETNFIIIDETLGLEATDSTVQYLRHINDYRMGAQSAIVSTLMSKREQLQNYDFIATLDGDGEDSPRDFSKLLESAIAGNEIVLASRAKRYSGLKFKIGHLFFQFIFLLLTGHLLRTGTFAVVDAKWMKNNIVRPEFAFSYSGALAALPARRETIPCQRDPRRQGLSKMKLQDSVTDGLRLLLPFSSRIAARSFILFIITTFTALLASSWIITVNVLGEAAPGWTTSALILVGLAMTASAVIALVTIGIMGTLLLARPNNLFAR